MRVTIARNVFILELFRLIRSSVILLIICRAFAPIISRA
jgi:hypothetical protein